MKRILSGSPTLYGGMGIALLLGIGFLLLQYFSEGVMQSGDGVWHYFISRYSWENPHLFLHHWGKPLFTLLSSPFAQLGYMGMVLFNVLLFITTSYFLIRTARSFELSYAWSIPFLLVLAPVYYRMVIGGMTEILFGTIATVSFYYLHKGRFLLGSIIVSFIIFTRPEGMVVLPFFALYILLRSPRHLPFLLTGFLLYGAIGWPYYDSFLWYFTETPYNGAEDVYGSGSLFHFITSYKNIVGLPIAILLLLGIGFLTIEIFQRLRRGIGGSLLEKELFWWLLVFLPFLAVLVVHSFLWWQGLKGSLGLVRVLATVIPHVSLLGVLGIDRVRKLIGRLALPDRVIRYGFTLLILLFLFASYVAWEARVAVPIPLKGNKAVVHRAGEWYKEQGHEGTVYYFHPYFVFVAGLDPYDEDRTQEIFAVNKEKPSKGLEEGDLIVWDSHFGPDEGGFPLDLLERADGLRKVKTFRVRGADGTVKKDGFAVHVFEVRAKGADRGEQGAV